MLIEEGDRVSWQRFYLTFKGRLRVKNRDSGDVEKELHLDYSLAQGYPMGTLSVLI